MSEALYHLLRSAILLVLGLYLLGSQVQGQTMAAAWSDQETRLANQYLSFLVAEPEYGRVLELLWNLYEKHDATALLLDNVSQQAKTNRHPSVLMVLGHLHRKKGDLKQASTLYEEVIQQKPAYLLALRARADVAQEQGDAEAAIKYITLVLEAMSESDPARIRTLMHLGSLKLGADKNEEAVRIWEKAAALKPGDFDLTRQVAESILRAGFPDRAAAF
jgi:tetratricopeptide (TPR) repeat protein